MPQHTEWIPFQQKLQQKIDDMLQTVGFKLNFSEIKDTETTLIYNRFPSHSEEQQVVQFDGILWSDMAEGEARKFNWLRVYAMSQNITLVVKRLSPRFKDSDQSLDGFHQGGWIYTDESGLDTALDEISEIVSSRLLSWFEAPTTDLPK